MNLGTEEYNVEILAHFRLLVYISLKYGFVKTGSCFYALESAWKISSRFIKYEPFK